MEYQTPDLDLVVELPNCGKCLFDILLKQNRIEVPTKAHYSSVARRSSCLPSGVKKFVLRLHNSHPAAQFWWLDLCVHLCAPIDVGCFQSFLHSGFQGRTEVDPRLRRCVGWCR